MIEERYENAPPCPVCRSTDLSVVEWADDAGDYDAIECNSCLCCAPAPIWMAMREIQNGVDVRIFHPHYQQKQGVA